MNQLGQFAAPTLSARAERNFRRALVLMGLLALALIAAVVTMRLAIHGAEVTVPDLHGMTATDAIRKSSGLGLSATIADRFYNADTPLGSVVTQFPAPGTRVRRDFIVRLVESLGPQSVSIPNVTGMSQREAQVAIRKAHLDLGTVAVVPYAAAPSGTVIAQDPPAAPNGVDRASVALLVANGGDAAAAQAATSNATAPVPAITGLPFQSAAQQLLRAGFKLAPVQDASAQPGLGAGTVVAQKPAAGVNAPVNSMVQLTVAH